MSNINKDKVLVLGDSGMLGHSVFWLFFIDKNYDTIYTVHSGNMLKLIEEKF